MVSGIIVSSIKKQSKFLSKIVLIYFHSRFYWERRQPVDPESPERFMAEVVET